MTGFWAVLALGTLLGFILGGVAGAWWALSCQRDDERERIDRRARYAPETGRKVVQHGSHPRV